MAPIAKKNFFTCTCCGKSQNVDQSVHIDENYCVTCYNKEQVYRDFLKKLRMYKLILKKEGKYTEIRRKKIKVFKTISEILIPANIFDLEDTQVMDILYERRKEAFKEAIKEVALKYKIDQLNEKSIDDAWIESMKEIWDYKTLRFEDQMEKFTDLWEGILDIKKVDKDKFEAIFKDLQKTVRLQRFNYIKTRDKFEIKPLKPFFKFSNSYIEGIVKTYQREIAHDTKQINLFRYFVNWVGNDCQFQTAKDALKESIEKYILYTAKEDVDKIFLEMNDHIKSLEDSHLIPNIAKYIMDTHEHTFARWYCKILPFNKSRFTASKARTGSRTDFIVNLAYIFKNKELNAIADALRENTEKLIRDKYEVKIERYVDKEGWTQERIDKRIQGLKDELQEELQPEKLKETQEKNADTAPMVARYLLLNAEKAFNMVMNRIIQYQYKRLKIRTPVYSFLPNLLGVK